MLQLEELAGLVEELRQRGYDIGTQECLNAHRLFLALAAEGRAPHDAGALTTLLAPLFCSTPVEQDDFHAWFSGWLERQRLCGQQEAGPRPTPAPTANGYKALPRLRYVLAAIVIVAVAVVGWRYFFSAPDDSKPTPTRTVTPTPTPTPTATETPTPTPPPIPTHPDSPWQSLDWRVFVSVLPLLFFVLFLVWLFKSRRLRQVLKRAQTDRPPELRQVPVAGIVDTLFQPSQTRRIAQEMRRHRETATRELDPVATAAATANKGGVFTAVFAGRKALPEYLALVDRISFRDHQACWSDQLVGRLAQHGVFIERFYFSGDPRICQEKFEIGCQARLADLTAIRADHDLLVFSDGACLFDPLSGEPRPWLDTLGGWGQRVLLLTPVPPARWGRREGVLRASGFIVLPADASGLMALTGLGETPMANVLGTRPVTRPYPEILQRREDLVFDHRPPPEAEIDCLCTQLKTFLGIMGFRWLCACGAYPLLYWDITLYFGHRLIGDPGVIETIFAGMMRLPWFRHGGMPDWLRVRLRDELPVEERERIAMMLDELLKSNESGGARPISLEIAVPPDDERAGRIKVALAAFRSVRRRVAARKQLAREVRHSASQSPLRDYVFMTFLYPGESDELAVLVPEVWREQIPQFRHEAARRAALARVWASVLGSRRILGASLAMALVGLAIFREDIVSALWPSPDLKIEAEQVHREREKAPAAETGQRIAEKEQLAAIERERAVAAAEREQRAAEQKRAEERQLVAKTQAEGTARAAREAQIKGIIDNGNRALAANRLTTPLNDNAVKYARDLMQFDSEHPEAQRLVSAVIDRYISFAEQALERGELNKARESQAKANQIATEFRLSDEPIRDLAARIATAVIETREKAKRDRAEQDRLAQQREAKAERGRQERERLLARRIAAKEAKRKQALEKLDQQKAEQAEREKRPPATEPSSGLSSKDDDTKTQKPEQEPTTQKPPFIFVPPSF